jgi:hypothetical protein
MSPDPTTTTTCSMPDLRHSSRRPLGIAGRLVWKDSRGTTRFNSVVIRDISETGAYVEHLSGSPIPLYRLVSLQAERPQQADALPQTLRQGKVPSAVFRVEAASATTGTPEGYGLRLLIEPRRRAVRAVRTGRPDRIAQLVVAEASA